MDLKKSALNSFSSNGEFEKTKSYNFKFSLQGIEMVSKSLGLQRPIEKEIGN